RLRQVHADLMGVIGAAAACLEVVGISRQRRLDGDQLAGVAAILGAGDVAGALDGLPVIEDVDAIGGFAGVCAAEAAQAGAAATAYAQRAKAFIAAIGEMNSRCDADKVGFLADGELEPRGRAVEFDWLSHGKSSVSPPASKTGRHSERLLRTNIDWKPAFTRLLRRNEMARYC